MPNIKESQLIYICSAPDKKPAVVSAVLSPDGNICEVVYLDGIKAIAESVKWDGKDWVFVSLGVCGTYANNPRLAPYAAQLRAHVHQGKNW